MITQVTVERLYNLGNYENIRLAAVAMVENEQVGPAFAEARTAVEAHYAAFLAEREEAERLRREEYEAEQARRRAEYEARYAARQPQVADDDDDDLYESGNDVFAGNPDDE